MDTKRRNAYLLYTISSLIFISYHAFWLYIIFMADNYKHLRFFNENYQFGATLCIVLVLILIFKMKYITNYYLKGLVIVVLILILLLNINDLLWYLATISRPSLDDLRGF